MSKKIYTELRPVFEDLTPKMYVGDYILVYSFSTDEKSHMSEDDEYSQDTSTWD